MSLGSVPACRSGLAIAALILVSLAGPAKADPVAPRYEVNPVQLCEQAIAKAEANFHLPSGLLGAMARVESGRGGKPWPWTLNVEGRSIFAETREEAVRKAGELIARGRRLVDLGCLQVNWRWHQEGFPSPEWLLHPENNVQYAAWFLASLRFDTGSWTEAVARYHANNPVEQTRYLCSVLRQLGETDAACAEHGR